MGLLFLFFPLGFLSFSHSIPARNGANWWVYYCGIVLCFGLGLYHHGSNSKPTHTDYDSIGQSNGSKSLYLLLLRDFQILFYKANVKVFFFFNFFFKICGLNMHQIWFFRLDCFSFGYMGKIWFLLRTLDQNGLVLGISVYSRCCKQRTLDDNGVFFFF